MAAFQEVFRRSGIDEGRSPPGMVVPFGGSNIVALIDPGKKLKVDPNPHALGIKEIDGADTLRRVMQTKDTFSAPDIDPQLRAASLPATFNGDARFFEIDGRIKPIPFPGLEVVARSAGRKIEAKLYVVVLPEIKIKVAFRNVMIPGSGGAPAFHAKKPCSEQDELLTMNNIWRPQANIRFERVPTDWLVIDDSQAAVKQELANATGMKDASLAILPDVIDVEKLKSFFAKHKVQGAHLSPFSVSTSFGPRAPFPMARLLDRWTLPSSARNAGLTRLPMKPGIFSAPTRRARPSPGTATATHWRPIRKPEKKTGRKTSRC
ncbi:hypothetical protein ACVWZL_007232 [Bradyrhizobium sp. GM2.4]